MKTSEEWLGYYQNNAVTLLEIPWFTGADLTPDEARAIQQSLREFQAGERSEGHHLIAHARAYGRQSGDQAYFETMLLFIAEEQRHARDLGRFLILNGIPLVLTTFTDKVFRGLRNLVPSLEVSIAVLITAEIIAKVYYAALREATRSVVLRRLCDQILHDELSHVTFQSNQLWRLRSKRGRGLLAVTMGLQRFLFFGTVLIVFVFHRPVIRRANLKFSSWWRECWREFEAAFGFTAFPPSCDN